MKPLLSFVAGACCAMVISSARAAQTCVWLDTSGRTSCLSYYDYNTPDWRATCSYQGKTTSVRGIAVCSDMDADNYTVTDTITTGDNAADNKYCWGRIISPGVSKWVRYNGGADGDNCSKMCAKVFSFDIQDAPPSVPYLRSALFTTIGQ